MLLSQKTIEILEWVEIQKALTKILVSTEIVLIVLCTISMQYVQCLLCGGHVEAENHIPGFTMDNSFR
jgi:hypothetical protein